MLLCLSSGTDLKKSRHVLKSLSLCNKVLSYLILSLSLSLSPPVSPCAATSHLVRNRGGWSIVEQSQWKIDSRGRESVHVRERGRRRRDRGRGERWSEREV